MSTRQYDPDHIPAFYAAYGAREWDRLEADAAARVSFHLHRELLRQYIAAGDAVLDAGAGPGCFTIELARLGARVTVGDLKDALMSPNGHYCHMFRWSELAALLAQHPCEVVAASASNFLALGNEKPLAALDDAPALWGAGSARSAASPAR